MLDKIWVLIATVLAFILGIMGTRLYGKLQMIAFQHGTHFGAQQVRAELGLPREDVADVSSDATLGMSAKPQNINNIIFDRYELVFALDLTGFLSSGSFAPQWINIVNRINMLIQQQFATFPPDTNTIIVRAIRFPVRSSA